MQNEISIKPQIHREMTSASFLGKRVILSLCLCLRLFSVAPPPRSRICNWCVSACICIYVWNASICFLLYLHLLLMCLWPVLAFAVCIDWIDWYMWCPSSWRLTSSHRSTSRSELWKSAYDDCDADYAILLLWTVDWASIGGVVLWVKSICLLSCRLSCQLSCRLH